jgi:tetratricopeptide (TPR) repeat protein
MYRSFLFTTAGLVGTIVALVQPVSAAKSSSEVNTIARAVTVKIKLNRNVGSGIIIHRQGDLYTLATNRHVVCGGIRCATLPNGEKYELRLPDGQVYRVTNSSVKLLGKDLDLAIIRFRSNRNYVVAKVAIPKTLKINDRVYAAGFPFAQPGFVFSSGESIAVVNKRLVGDNGGYTVVYNALTLPGMSGGGVFDDNGRLVAIHGIGDRFQENTDLGNKSRINSKIGYNRGIPVHWLTQNLLKVGIKLGDRSTPIIYSDAQKQAINADEYFIAGFNKFVDPGSKVLIGKRQAVQKFGQAIGLNPKYEYAYFMRAVAYEQLQDFQQSMDDYNKLIALRPNLFGAYYNRAALKMENLNDYSGALADFNQALLLSPDNADTYYGRAILKTDKLDDYPGALTDFNQAITINPEFSEAYYSRALLKATKLNDPQGALADYDRAILINPKFANAYNNRANLKYIKLRDIPGALADYDEALSFNPNDGLAYYNRASLKKNELNDLTGAIEDFRQAAQLFRAQKQTQNLRLALEALQSLGVSE